MSLKYDEIAKDIIGPAKALLGFNRFAYQKSVFHPCESVAKLCGKALMGLLRLTHPTEDFDGFTSFNPSYTK